MRRLWHGPIVTWLRWLLPLWVLMGCEPLYQTYSFTEPRPTTLPVTVAADEVWVSSIPTGADVYVLPYDAEALPVHSTDPEAHRGTTPLRLALPPGQYWIEVALDAEVFANYFSPPYDDVQFEQDGAASEALIFKPFVPGDKRRVLRYYRVEKQPQQGERVIALFHPRGVSLERVAPLYPTEEQFQFDPEELPLALQPPQLPAEAQAPLVNLMRRGGKAVWNKDGDYRVALQVQAEGIQARVIELFTGPPQPDPLLPDGGGL